MEFGGWEKKPDVCIDQVYLAYKGSLVRGIIPRKSFGRPHHGLAYIVSGHATYHFDSGDARVKPGTVMFLNKDAYYAITIDSDDYCFFCVDFEILWAIRLTLNSSALALTRPEPIEHIFFRLEKCWQQKQAVHKLRARGLLYEMIALILEDRRSTYQPSEKYVKIEPAVRYLEHHYFEPELSGDCLPELAGGMTAVHFRRLFKEIFRVSPQRYLILLRVRQAKDLLRCQLYSVAEVAELVGYANANYFSKAFKKETGQNPWSFMHGR